MLVDILAGNRFCALATLFDGNPHACFVYFAYQSAPLSVYFRSDPRARHMATVESGQHRVAIAIRDERATPGRAIGCQLNGVATLLHHPNELRVAQQAFAHRKRWPSSEVRERIDEHFRSTPNWRWVRVDVERAEIFDTLRFGKTPVAVRLPVPSTHG